MEFSSQPLDGSDNIHQFARRHRTASRSPAVYTAVDEHLHELQTIEATTQSAAATDHWRSARTGLTAGQKGAGYGLIGVSLTYIALCPQPTVAVLGLVIFAMFAANTALRLFGLLLVLFQKRKTHEDDCLGAAAETLPVYTLLVPVYREANVIGDLTESLRRLNYPQHKLDIKFLLEADDKETIEAVRAACSDSGDEILILPPTGLRTKPRALNYGLKYARGEYVVVFDAEDRPHPDQLLTTLRAFQNGGEKLAVVQSRLQPYNGSECWISGNFEWEYIRQFRILLPLISKLGWPMQLGGTSNYFRTNILKEIGGWDSYNVTEDAEIGMYIFLKGYESTVVDCPTMEEAPISIAPFVNQRTRWIKGHIQTWLVLMRRPQRFIARVGLLPFLGFQISFGCGILSAFLFAPGTLMLLANMDEVVVSGRILCAILIISNLVMIMIEIGICRTEQSGYWKRLSNIPFLPMYLALQFVAAVRALWELKTNPHRWVKTPHGLTAVSSP